LVRVTKTERWLNLIAFLLDHHYPVAREELLGQVDDYAGDWNSASATRRESARRKFERDKKELRDLGVVLETTPVAVEHTDQPVEGYLLRARDFYLPYIDVRTRRARSPGRPYGLGSVTLEPEEVPVLRRAAERVARLGDTGLGAAAKSALRKLSFDRPELDTREGEHTLTPPARPGFEREFATLLHAVRKRRAVSCHYYSIGRDDLAQRSIEPYGMMLSWGRWYCVGRARDRNALRVFRVDRMRDVRMLDDDDADFDVPRSFDIQSYLDRSPWELSNDKPVAARIRVAFPQSRWVLGEGLGRVVKAVTRDGGTELEFAVRSKDPFLRWLLSFGQQVEVLSPPSLKRDLASLRERIRARYD
jgi:predicted DNA-binding transcriptional regulator YafY